MMKCAAAFDLPRRECSNRPSISDQINESTTRDIILAKDTSGNFFADGFTPPLPQRQGDRTTNGIGGSNTGNGSGALAQLRVQEI